MQRKTNATKLTLYKFVCHTVNPSGSNIKNINYTWRWLLIVHFKHSAYFHLLTFLQCEKNGQYPFSLLFVILTGKEAIDRVDGF